MAFATDEIANRSDVLEIVGSGVTSYGTTAEEALMNILEVESDEDRNIH